MKVFELIEKLKTMDQDALVLHRGYEDGYDAADNDGPVEVLVVENLDAQWYNGKYEMFDWASNMNSSNRYDTDKPINAVIV